MDVVTRVGEAIDAAISDDDFGHEDCESCKEAASRARALAAIAAVLDSMAEPSEGAYQAWWDRCHMGGDIIDDREGPDDENGHIKRTWQAMLSAMRAEMLGATGETEV